MSNREWMTDSSFSLVNLIMLWFYETFADLCCRASAGNCQNSTHLKTEKFRNLSNIYLEMGVKGVSSLDIFFENEYPFSSEYVLSTKKFITRHTQTLKTAFTQVFFFILKCCSFREN